MSVDAELIILTNQTRGTLDGPLWGQFIELAGRCINGGLYDPKHTSARPDGTRGDVFDAVRELQPSYIRYPGGCAAAYWDWQELVGPREQRPRAKYFRLPGVPQSSDFGIDEAWKWANEMGSQLYFTVNAHTQTPEDAANLAEYLNADTPTKWADLRRKHGREEPYGVKLFGLGNEIYGDWQPGSKTADEYVAWCKEAINQMKRVDPTIKIVCVGLGRPGPDWDRKVLKGLIDRIDLISVHNYFGRPNFKDCMTAGLVFEEMIKWANVAVDEAMDTLLTRKERPGLCCDEWNVWYRSTHNKEADLEEIFDYADALTVATLFHAVLRNTASVKMSNISLLINTCGSLFTARTPKGELIKQTIYWPQRMLRTKMSGRVCETAYDGPTFDAKHERYFCGIVDVEKAKDESLPTLLKFKGAPALDTVVAIDERRGRMCVSVVNKLEDRPLDVKLDFHGKVKPGSNRVKVHQLTSKGLAATNTAEHPNEVGLTSREERVGEMFAFPAASHTVLEFEL
jgi:alpha-L-arabinofuranosidase